MQKLDAIDNKRCGGIFCGDMQHIPEGQGRARELLDGNYGASFVFAVWVTKANMSFHDNCLPKVCVWQAKAMIADFKLPIKVRH